MKVVDVDIPAKPAKLSEAHTTATQHHRLLSNSAGFTLVELIVVTAILGALATIALPAYNRFMQNVKTTRAIAEIRAIEKDIIAVIVDSNTLPNSLNDIGHGLLRDPWGNLYQYLNFANAGTPRQDDLTFDLNTDFDIYSLGPDGVSHTNVKHANSLDDVVRANDGGWIGTGVNF